jgi:pimeloyl-ACP methyl ester carboxylesterase
VSRVAVLLHGAGSCPETAVRLLGGAVPSGAQVRAPAWQGSVHDALTALEQALGSDEAVLVGGVSLGAHAAALAAARSGSRSPLLLVMPAWTGAPGPVALATAAAADDVERRGSAGVLAALAQDPAMADDWVLDELARGWARYDDQSLVLSLRAAASSPAPSRDELRRICAPTAVVALDDDPLHPLDVAQEWADAVPGARLTVVGRHEPHLDRGALGKAGARDLLGLSGSR